MQNHGLIRQGAGNAILKSIPIPKLEDDYILVRTEAIALNPTDWTTLDAKGDDGTLVGCDYAGIVVEVGKAVTKSFAVGDRVAGFAHGGNDSKPWTGAFARYIAVKGDLQLRVPTSVGFEAASTVGVGSASAAYALYKVLGLPFRRASELKEPVLIYGGSTATGTLAIQFAKLSGCTVITTCSPKHFELMRDRGADVVFDYQDENVGEKIRRATDNKLRLIFDTVAVESSAAICGSAFGSSGGIYCSLLDMDCSRDGVVSTPFLGYTMSGEEFTFEGDYFAAAPDDFKFAAKCLLGVEDAWTKGEWKPHPESVLPSGLLGAVDGMNLMREGRGPRGEKWVYRVDETSWPEE